MKKQYIAPDIMFESFSLSVSIASDCTAESNWNQDQCGYRWDAETVLFMNGIDVCTDWIIDGDPDYNGICYHNPTPEKQLFGS